MKERLTGAIILVALLVLLVPELLTGPSPAARSPSSAVEGAPLRSYTIDLADDAGTRPPGSAAPTSEPSGVASDEPVEQAFAEPESAGAGESASSTAGDAVAGPDTAAERPRSAFGPAAAPPQETSPARPSAQTAVPPAPAARASDSGASSGSGWMVQLGVFANRENAERLAKQVKDKGYRVVVDGISSKGKRLYRVRVGPEPDRAAAVALRAKLRAAGHPGSMVSP